MEPGIWFVSMVPFYTMRAGNGESSGEQSRFGLTGISKNHSKLTK
jgi:hypothetical protein